VREINGATPQHDVKEFNKAYPFRSAVKKSELQEVLLERLVAPSTNERLTSLVVGKLEKEKRDDLFSALKGGGKLHEYSEFVERKNRELQVATRHDRTPRARSGPAKNHALYAVVVTNSMVKHHALVEQMFQPLDRAELQDKVKPKKLLVEAILKEMQDPSEDILNVLTELPDIEGVCGAEQRVLQNCLEQLQTQCQEFTHDPDFAFMPLSEDEISKRIASLKSQGRIAMSKHDQSGNGEGVPGVDGEVCSQFLVNYFRIERSHDRDLGAMYFHYRLEACQLRQTVYQDLPEESKVTGTTPMSSAFSTKKKAKQHQGDTHEAIGTLMRTIASAKEETMKAEQRRKEEAMKAEQRRKEEAMKAEQHRKRVEDARELDQLGVRSGAMGDEINARIQAIATVTTSLTALDPTHPCFNVCSAALAETLAQAQHTLNELLKRKKAAEADYDELARSRMKRARDGAL